jgi:heme-degrading monooxygenase HmoA
VPVIPDLTWSAAEPPAGPGVVVRTRLELRRLRDVPAFFRVSVATYRQAVASPGARSVRLTARPLARRFSTVSWWDDAAAARTYAAAEPHRSAMRTWRARLAVAEITLQPGAHESVPAAGPA